MKLNIPKKGIAIASPSTNVFLKLFINVEEVPLNGHIFYINTSSLKKWKERNPNILQNKTLEEFAAQEVLKHKKQTIWGYDFEKKVFWRAKLNLRNKQIETTEYKQGDKLGDGFSAIAYKLEPVNKGKKAKAVKIAKHYNNDLLDEFNNAQKLIGGVKRTGLQLPLKAILYTTNYAIIESLYDGCLNNIQLNPQQLKEAKTQTRQGLKYARSQKAEIVDIHSQNIFIRHPRKHYGKQTPFRCDIADFGFLKFTHRNYAADRQKLDWLF